MAVKTIGKARVATADGQGLHMEADALALISKALEQKADWLVVPVSDITPDFFRLKTGFAGAVCQKFVNYGVRLAIIGDISAYVAKSRPLADFVRESNRGRQIWFVEDMEEMRERLEGR
jgi:Domain of unknown function (DUF4180)